MNRVSRTISMLVVSGALLAPASFIVRAAPKPQTEQQEDHQSKEHYKKAEKADKQAQKADKQEAKATKAARNVRVYDAKHNRYHDWTDTEDRSYRHYLSDRHEEYHDYGTLTPDKQADYWEWRQVNPDAR